MKEVLFLFKCNNCGMQFKAPMLSDFSYGNFLLHTVTGYHAHLDAIENMHFEEISNLLEKMVTVKKMDERRSAKLLHSIYGTITDNAPDGSQYHIDKGPYCVKCGYVCNGIRKRTEPPETIDVPEVTYHKWDALNDDQKKNLILCAIEDYLKHEY